MIPSDGAANGSEQPLQTPWTFWYDRCAAEPYGEALQRLGTVHTVQAFWRYYCNLTRPGQLQPGDNFHLFRGALLPATESLPEGGCWAYRLRRAAADTPESSELESEANRLWEKLLLSLVGETIGEPSVVGAIVCVRASEIVFSVYARSRTTTSTSSRLFAVFLFFSASLFCSIVLLKTL